MASRYPTIVTRTECSPSRRSTSVGLSPANRPSTKTWAPSGVVLTVSAMDTASRSTVSTVCRRGLIRNTSVYSVYPGRATRMVWLPGASSSGSRGMVPTGSASTKTSAPG